MTAHILVDQFLQTHDDLREHPAESLALALRNITADEWYWQHPAYADEPMMPGLPPPGTPAWHVVHLAHCARHYARILEGLPEAVEDDTPPPEFSGANDLLRCLDEERSRLHRRIAQLDDGDLDAAVVYGRSVRDFLGMVMRHDAWHAGQIAMLRRLYRHRSAPGR